MAEGDSQLDLFMVEVYFKWLKKGKDNFTWWVINENKQVKLETRLTQIEWYLEAKRRYEESKKETA